MVMGRVINVERWMLDQRALPLLTCFSTHML